MQNSKTKIIFLCFHYLKRSDAFKRIWGYDFELFKRNIDFLLKEFPPVSFQQFNDFLQGKANLPSACSVLTFDDGLKEHAQIIASYLAKKGIKAVFSVPTCIFQGEMALPQVIHFATAKYGIRNFYKLVKKYFPITKLNFSDYFNPGWETLGIYSFYSKVKKVLLYQMPSQATEEVLRAIFFNVLKKDQPDILDRIYLNKQELAQLVKMGHTIACHTYSHFSFSQSVPSESQWRKEIIEPKGFLESITGQIIDVFSYPYGSSKDKFNFTQWSERLKDSGFRYALNAYRDFRGDNIFDSFWIERYSVGRKDTPRDIQENVYCYTLLKSFF